MENDKPKKIIKVGDFVRYYTDKPMPTYGLVIWVVGDEAGVEISVEGEAPAVIKKRISELVRIGGDLKS